ncbi:hypothetical protein M0R89_01510 [Halorussus limi]|uniref:Big-1 domain-containing protein n=1 Tax=Halorussus limi TaxID=2938695 RepID=A0A8U0HVK3_9EURY|nr:hypothetical protein [Halorussus limi]UPV74763.1 hypothetical protein M0R89_01510 [Halorussus limi]
MRLRTDERGVTVQIGTVLLFAVLVILLSVYQASVVPQQNEQVEFTHNQRVQGQLQDLQDELHRTAATGSDGSTSIALGTQYPVRAFFVNPAPPSGTLRTTPPANLTLRNATASGETGDYWTGGAHNFSTRGLTYDPVYHVYQNPPTTIYDNGVLYNRFDDANRTLAGQQLVKGNTISLVALNGSLSESSSGTATVEMRAVSPATRTVTVGNETSNLSLVLPTRLPADEWERLLAAEMNRTAGDDRYVRAVEEVSGRSAVRLVLENATYELELAKVGVGTDVTETRARYVTDVRGDDASVAENSEQKVVVEVRDRFNNPVSGATVNVTLDSGLSGDIAAQGQRGDQLTDLTTDDEGRVTVRYVPPTDFDGENSEVEVRVGMDSVPPTGSGFDPGTPANLSANLTAVNADGSGLGETGGNGSDAAYQTRWDVPAIEAEPGMTCYANDTCRYDRSVERSVTLTANTTPTAQNAPVEFSVSDTSVAEFTADQLDTWDDGRRSVELDTSSTGVVNAYAASGGSGDALRIEVYDSGDGGGPPAPNVQLRLDDLSHVNENAVDYVASYDVSNTNASFQRVSVVFDNVNRGPSATGVENSTAVRGNERYSLDYAADEDWTVTARVIYENDAGEEYVAASDSITDTADALNPNTNDDLSRAGSPAVSSYGVSDRSNPGQGPRYRIDYAITENGNFSQVSGAAISLGGGGADAATRTSATGRIDLQPGYGRGTEFRVKLLVFDDEGAVVAVRAETDTAS